MTTASASRTHRTRRPIWVAVPLIVLGAVLVAGLIAFASHHTFYAVLLYSAVIGLAGGVLGWALVDELSQQGTWLAGLAGFTFAAGTYLLYRYIEYRLAGTAEGIWGHLADRASEGAVLRRRPGASGLEVGESAMWVIWGLELTVASVVGTLLGRSLEI